MTAVALRGTLRAGQLEPGDYVHALLGYRVLRRTDYPNGTVHLRGWTTTGEIGVTTAADTLVDATRILDDPPVALPCLKCDGKGRAKLIAGELVCGECRGLGVHPDPRAPLAA